MEYTVDYFIRKFSKIPEEKWTTGDWCIGDKFCSNGFCGMHGANYNFGTPEAVAFNKLIKHLKITIDKNSIGKCEKYFWSVSVYINDGDTEEYQQPTPKQRILAALYDIKKLQEEQVGKAPKTIIKYVSVPTSIIEKEIVLS